MKPGKIAETDIPWQFNVCRRFSWLVEFFQVAGTDSPVFRRVYNLDFGFSNMKKDNQYNEFLDSRELDFGIRLIQSKMKSDSSFLRKIASKSYSQSGQLMKTARLLSKQKPCRLSSAQLASLWKKMAGQLLDYQPVIFLIFPLEAHLEKELLDLVEQQSRKRELSKNVPEIMALLSMPKEELVMVREEKHLLQIAIAVSKQKNVEKKIKQHLRLFAWIPTDDPLGKPWTETDVLQRARELATQKPEQKLLQMKKMGAERENAFKKLLFELNLSKEERGLVSSVREFVFLRNYRVECWVQAQFLVRPFLEEIANRLYLSFDELTALNHLEIGQAILGNKTIDKKMLAERMSSYSYVKIGGKTQFFFGPQSNQIPVVLPEAIPASSESILRGKTANKGVVRGRVCIVRELSDLPLVQRGDILVASMTVPQFIPAMEKAAAFVTDEGGITCHAAIVSRELGVPCVVGTGSATRSLQNGDWVEVDGDKGIVRKIAAPGH